MKDSAFTIKLEQRLIKRCISYANEIIAANAIANTSASQRSYVNPDYRRLIQRAVLVIIGDYSG